MATVTKEKGWFARVEANIARLTAAGIPIKLNTLCRRGINSGPKALERHLVQAAGLGARGIKFIELLVTEANRKYYG